MNASKLIATFVFSMLIVVTAVACHSSLTAAPGQPGVGSSELPVQQPVANEVQQRQARKIDYAQLMILENEYTFAIGGQNIVPRTFDLNGLYRQLGGRARPSMVNLLDQIGTEGWELIDVSNDRTVYLFKR